MQYELGSVRDTEPPEAAQSPSNPYFSEVMGGNIVKSFPMHRVIANSGAGTLDLDSSHMFMSGFKLVS